MHIRVNHVTPLQPLSLSHTHARRHIRTHARARAHTQTHHACIIGFNLAREIKNILKTVVCLKKIKQKAKKERKSFAKKLVLQQITVPYINNHCDEYQ